MLGGNLSKFRQISSSFQFEKRKIAVGRFVASEKVLLGSSCCRTFGGYLDSGRQACWLAWRNLSLRPLSSRFFFFSRLVFVITGSVGEPWFFVKIGLLPWSGHCLIPALEILPQTFYNKL